MDRCSCIHHLSLLFSRNRYHTHTHIYIHIHTHTHIYIYTHIYTHTHTHTHTYTHTYTYIHTYIQVCSLVVKLLRSQSPFPLCLRLLRIISVIVLQYHTLLVTECEIFLSMLVRFVSLHRNTIVAVVLLFREGRTTPYPRHTVRVRVRVRVVVVVLVSVVIDA